MGKKEQTAYIYDTSYNNKLWMTHGVSHVLTYPGLKEAKCLQK